MTTGEDRAGDIFSVTIVHELHRVHTLQYKHSQGTSCGTMRGHVLTRAGKCAAARKDDESDEDPCVPIVIAEY